jgi:hypothetical protein
MAPITILLDTHAFLHYRSLEEIDWLKLLGADDVSILIAPVVTRELDKIKVTHDKKKIRKRAAAALSKIAESLRKPPPRHIRSGVELRFRQSEPSIDFDAHRLNDKISDDWLIATALELREEYPNGRLVIVTNDVGFQMKAVGHGLECVEIPEEYSLPDLPDPDELRTRELERELTGYRRAAPDLRLTFLDGKDHLRVQLARIPLPGDEDISRRMTELRLAHPRATKPERYSGAELMLGGVGPLDIDRHNDRTEKFYVEYERYLKSLDKFEDAQRRLFQIAIVLRNTGYSPAEDIDIYLHLPDGLTIAEDVESLMTIPNEPRAPVGPRSTMQEQAEQALASIKLTNIAHLRMPDFSHIDAIGANVSSPTIRRTNSFEVQLNVQQLKHTLEIEFDPLFVLFDSWETTKSIAIRYRILAANVPTPIRGDLHVAVQIAEPTR